MTISERPGVYTSYSVSGTRYSSAPSAVAGVAAGASSGTAGRIYTITSYENAADIFGAESDITALIKTLFLNSVTEIKAVPILEGTESEYSSAFKSLCGEEDVKAIICGSDDTDNIKALKAAILTSDKRNAHKIAFAEADCAQPQNMPPRQRRSTAREWCWLHRRLLTRTENGLCAEHCRRRYAERF